MLAPLVQHSTTFDPQRDLVPVGLALRAIGMFATSAKSGLRTMKDFVAYAKAHPGVLNFGSAGIGATNHIAIEQMKTMAGIDLVHVPFVARLNQALNAALADTHVKAYAQANGWLLAGGPPQVLADVIARDLAEVPELIRRLDLKPGG